MMIPARAPPKEVEAPVFKRKEASGIQQGSSSTLHKREVAWSGSGLLGHRGRGMSGHRGRGMLGHRGRVMLRQRQRDARTQRQSDVRAQRQSNVRAQRHGQDQGC